MTTVPDHTIWFSRLVAGVSLAAVLVAIGSSAFGGAPGGLPEELTSAIGRTLSEPSVHVEGVDANGSIIEDYEAPDRARWTANSPFGDRRASTSAYIAGCLYLTDLRDPARYVSCPFRGPYVTPSLSVLATLRLWGTLEASDPQSDGGRRYRVGLGREPREFRPANVSVLIVVRGGLVKEIIADGARLHLHFQYRAGHVNAPPRHLVTFKRDCGQAVGDLVPTD